MTGSKYTDQLLYWYQASKITADRIINDLKKQSFEAVMHLYAYTAKSLKLEYIVSQQGYPFLFSNNYTRVGDTLAAAITFLMSEGNMSFASPDRVRKTLKYWLVCGNLYETLVSKVIIKASEAKERIELNGFSDLKQQLVGTSILNGIKTQHDWDRFFGVEISEDDEDGAVTERKVKLIPAELQTEAARRILDKAISLGLCDCEYQWLKTKSLLAYFADCASEYLNLSRAEQDGKKKTYWKPFEALFGVSGLANYKNTYTNKTGKLPTGHEIVETIFH
ncbi:DUF6043 family protein [Prevotella sp. KH2C16]|uniref:DUF6043 family protein n=1 Tax=Prevotella sp. KH2C16 TaxID=1855325 RepID=UPI0008E14120|nr:DUF6043 family protein [Prevotella sp. KH2C16]SFG71565.1 hypothetical protein SAMN05216383_1327 [Prevotella sp. KH2C16]